MAASAKCRRNRWSQAMQVLHGRVLGRAACRQNKGLNAFLGKRLRRAGTHSPAQHHGAVVQESHDAIVAMAVGAVLLMLSLAEALCMRGVPVGPQFAAFDPFVFHFKHDETCASAKVLRYGCSVSGRNRYLHFGLLLVY
jgi:hypothetical protein